LSNNSEKLNPITMKKPIRLFAFVFFLFAVYLNVFYREDSFLARLTTSKNSSNKSQTTSQQPAVVKSSERELAEVQGK
jgi:hypothetical protein